MCLQMLLVTHSTCFPPFVVAKPLANEFCRKPVSSDLQQATSQLSLAFVWVTWMGLPLFFTQLWRTSEM